MEKSEGEKKSDCITFSSVSSSVLSSFFSELCSCLCRLSTFSRRAWGKKERISAVEWLMRGKKKKKIWELNSRSVWCHVLVTHGERHYSAVASEVTSDTGWVWTRGGQLRKQVQSKWTGLIREYLKPRWQKGGRRDSEERDAAHD